MYSETTKEIAEYVGREYKYGSDVRISIKNMKEMSIPEPEDPPSNATRSQERWWSRRSIPQDVVLSGMGTKAHPSFATVSASSDSLELLRVIKDQAFNFQNQKYNFQALHEAKRRFYLLKQDKWTSVQDYLEKFQNTVDVISQHQPLL